MSKLIMVDGLSTVGKSTFSKALAQAIGQIKKTVWIHEESLHHPIRDHEFEAGDIGSLEGMEKNRIEMLSRWQRFSDSMQNEEAIYVIEGCYLHSLDRYLLSCAWTHEQILAYLQQIAQILLPLEPCLVLLHRTDIFASYDREFPKRGQWWEDLIKAPRAIEGYAKNLLDPGESSIYLRTPKYQKYLLDTLKWLPMDSLAIETSEGRWDDYLKLVTKHLGLEIRWNEKPLAFLPERYVGKYTNPLFHNPVRIRYDKEANRLFLSSFWPYMELKYVGDDAFEMISFPATLRFRFGGDEPAFTIDGNYDWEVDIEGEPFLKVSDDPLS